MIVPRISDHALIRWLERAHGVDVEGFRRLMAQEIEASLRAKGLRRVQYGPALVISPDAEVVVTYLPDGFQRSPFQNGIAVARNLASREETV